MCVYDVSLAPNQATRLEPQQSSSFHSKGLAEQSLSNQHNSQALLPIHEPKRYMEDELTNLKRRIRAIEEYLALPSAHNMSSGATPLGAELDSLQDKRHLDTFQREPSSQVQILALNKSRLYGPTHWLHGGHEVGNQLITSSAIIY